jgi:hypothetical protein
MEATMTRITTAVRRELVRVLRERYREGKREERRRILEELVRLSGYHRKYAITVLNGRNGSSPASDAGARRGRPCLYDEAVRQALIVLWEASDRVCGKRLKAAFPLLIPALEAHGHLRLNATIRAKVMSVSAASIDRLLSPARSITAPRPRRLASALRKSVPVRTFSDWNDPLPGSMEADLVVHCGDTIAGSFVYTLTLTDIASGWTECVPLVVRESTLVTEAIEALRPLMPFPLRALDTDNGTEFLNDTLVQYCRERSIEFTRSRPYRKNDQAWVEQKNGAVVRRLVGYRRLEGWPAAEALSRLYSASRLFVNFFQPSFKLAEKTRDGAHIRKRYHPPQTPSQRLLASDAIPPEVKTKLLETGANLDPLRLLEDIRQMQSHLVALVEHGEAYTPSPTNRDLTGFLAGLSTAWRMGEARPTHRPKPKAVRYWRSRIDPFESAWPQLLVWLEADPDQTSHELFDRLRTTYPGVHPEGQLRTLQRRVKDRRAQMVRRLVFGLQEATTMGKSVTVSG